MITFKNNKIANIQSLEKIKSEYVEWEFENKEEEKEQALNLNRHIINILCDTINSMNCNIDVIGGHIVISIANYVKNGIFADRGGYGKLRLVTNNYEKFLSDELNKKFKKNFKITLVHDGTAMAAAFSNYKNSVCVSLGTAFGVGFPVIFNK